MNRHLDKIGKRRGILERMRGVGVEEAAAVRPQLLDRDLGRRGALGNGLRLAFQGSRRRVLFEVLNHALRAEEQGADERERQQDIYRAANHVDPEVADGILLAARESAHQCDGHSHPAAADTKFCTVRPTIWTK